MLSTFSASILSSDFRKLAFMTYGKRLKQALERANKDRAALASELGISVQAVGQVITGGRSGTQTFTASNNVKAAKFLRVDPHWLATGEGEIQPMVSVWPFSLLTPDQLLSLPPEHLETVQKVALDLLHISKSSKLSRESRADTGSVPRGKPLTGTIQKPEFMKKQSEQRNKPEGSPRKTGDGRGSG